MATSDAARLAALHLANAQAAYRQWIVTHAKVDDYEIEITGQAGSKPQAIQVLGKVGSVEYYRYKVLTGPRDWFERQLLAESAMATMYATYAKMGER
jgi:hypothetical protein